MVDVPTRSFERDPPAKAYADALAKLLNDMNLRKYAVEQAVKAGCAPEKLTATAQQLFDFLIHNAAETLARINA